MKKLDTITSFRLSHLIRQQPDPKEALKLFLNPNPNPNPNLKPFSYSLQSYDLIITKLGKAKMFDELDQVLVKLKLETRLIPKETIFCNIINYYSRAKLFDKAITLFDEIPSFRCHRSIKSLNTLLNGLLICRKFDIMMKIFVGIRYFDHPDTCTYNIMINYFRVQNDLGNARKVFDEMSKRRIKPNIVTFSTLMSALCGGLKLDEAFELKREMVRVYNVMPNVFVYASLIKGVSAKGELDSAFRLKDEMLDANIRPDSAVYTTLISGLFKAGRMDDVYGLLDEMKRTGCRPGTETYNALISGFCREKRFDLALRFLNEMEVEKCKPDVISFNVLIRAYCEEGKVREAMDLFEDMPRRGCKPDVVSYRILFNCLFDGMKLKEAALILDEMIFRGYSPYLPKVNEYMKTLHQEGNSELLVQVLSSTLAKGNYSSIDYWTFATSAVCDNDEGLNFHELFDKLTSGSITAVCRNRSGNALLCTAIGLYSIRMDNKQML